MRTRLVSTVLEPKAAEIDRHCQFWLMVWESLLLCIKLFVTCTNTETISMLFVLCYRRKAKMTRIGREVLKNIY